MNIREIEINELTDYVKQISLFRQNHNEIWFRGINNCKFHLQPSILRRKDLHSDDEFTNLENNIINRFKERSLPYIDQNLKDDLDVLFFMQHYGVPTRLLDWTENPFVALYFALIDGDKDSKKKYKHDANVWLIDPVFWNNNLLSSQSYNGGILSINDPQLSAFKPPVDYRMIPVYPLAIYGSYNSTRIVAQRGAFFIFGKQKNTIESIYNNDFSDECLLRLIVKKEKRQDLREELLKSGISESFVFPDLDGLAREIKRIHGFEE